MIGSLVGVAFLLGGIVMLLSGGLKHLSMDGQSGRITELEGVLLFGVVCFIGFLIALGWLALLIHLVGLLHLSFTHSHHSLPFRCTRR